MAGPGSGLQDLPPRQGLLPPHTATQGIAAAASDQTRGPQHIWQGAAGLVHGTHRLGVCGRQWGASASQAVGPGEEPTASQPYMGDSSEI